MNGALWSFVARRQALPCALCFLVPTLLGTILGILYPSYSRERAALEKLMPVIRRLFGGDLLDMFSPLGFFNIPFAHPLCMVALSLVVALPTLDLPAGERGRKGLDLLLSTRLERRTLVTTVLWFAAPASLLFSLAPILGIYLGGALSNVLPDLDFARYLKCSFALFLLALFLCGLSMLISVISIDRGAAGRRLAILVVAALMLEFAAEVGRHGSYHELTDWLLWFTPFGYYQPSEITAGMAHYARDNCVLLTGAMVLIGTAVVLEDRRKSV